MHVKITRPWISTLSYKDHHYQFLMDKQHYRDYTRQQQLSEPRRQVCQMRYETVSSVSLSLYIHTLFSIPNYYTLLITPFWPTVREYRRTCKVMLVTFQFNKTSITLSYKCLFDFVLLQLVYCLRCIKTLPIIYHMLSRGTFFPSVRHHFFQKFGSCAIFL